MRQVILASTITTILALGIFSALGQAPAQPRGVLGVLHAGQAASVKESGGRYEISLFENGPEMLGYKVVEVGTDYLVVEDIAGVSETRIPIFSVKSVVTLKVGK
jgi:hypothetical protein